MTGGTPHFSLTGPGTSPTLLLREVWAARRLIDVLARKDFYVRYRRTRLGMVWAVILPVVQATVLTLVFSSVVKTDRPQAAGVTGSSSYAVVVFAGMVAWSFFQAAFTAGSTSVVDSSSLAKRIYFPRIILPLIAVATAIYPLAVTLGVLLVLIATLGGGLGMATLWLVPALLLDVLLVLGMSLFFSAAQVYVRDLRFAISAATAVLFFLTPILYSASSLNPRVLRVVQLLPAGGPVELFRHSVGGADPQIWHFVASSVVWTVVLGGLGFWLHCRRDRVMMDTL